MAAPAYMTDECLAASRAVQSAVDDIANINKELKALKIEKEKAVNKVKDYMGDTEDLYNSRGDKLIVTYHTEEHSRVDIPELRAKHPRIVSKFTYIESTRKFLIKA
jgi:predicted phage-related endonuclease